MCNYLRKQTVKTTHQESKEIAVIDLSDEMLHESWCVFQEKLRKMIEGGQRDLLFNLQQLSCLNDKDMAKFVSVLRIIYQYEGCLKLAGAEPDIFQTFRSLKLEGIFALYSTEKKALQSFELDGF